MRTDMRIAGHTPHRHICELSLADLVQRDVDWRQGEVRSQNIWRFFFSFRFPFSFRFLAHTYFHLTFIHR